MGLIVRSLSMVVIVAVVGALVACGSHKTNVSSQVQEAISANKNSKTLAEYESSESHPEVMFENLRKEDKENSKAKSNSSQNQADNARSNTGSKSDDQATEANPKDMFSEMKDADGSEICKTLLALKPVDLTVFEEQIEDKENATLLKPCLVQLNNRLNGHYTNERSKLSVKLEPQTMQVVPEKAFKFRFADNVQYRDTSKGYMVWHGELKRKEVLLTFDDGPHAQYTPSVLNTLKQFNVKAIFFQMGKNVSQRPDLVKAVAAGGHSIGSHSMTHGCLAQNAMCENHNRIHGLNGGHALSEEQAMAEIKGAHQMIYDILGWIDPFFRFPYGEFSPNLRDKLNQAGVANFRWSIDSDDWKSQTPHELAMKVIGDVERNQTGVILFHDIQRKTAEALPEFLSELYARGYTPVVFQPRDSKARLADGLIKARARSVDIPTKP